MYFIHFYNRETGNLSKKPGYQTKDAATLDLKSNGFKVVPGSLKGEIWEREDFVARIKKY